MADENGADRKRSSGHGLPRSAMAPDWFPDRPRTASEHTRKDDEAAEENPKHSQDGQRNVQDDVTTDQTEEAVGFFCHTTTDLCSGTVY